MPQLDLLSFSPHILYFSFLVVCCLFFLSFFLLPSIGSILKIRQAILKT